MAQLPPRLLLLSFVPRWPEMGLCEWDLRVGFSSHLVLHYTCLCGGLERPLGCPIWLSPGLPMPLP